MAKDFDSRSRAYLRRLAEKRAAREAGEQSPPTEPDVPGQAAADAQAHRAAEEQARLAAEEEARRVAEEQARREAEEQARRAAEEQLRRAVEEKARREAETKARLEAEERAQREAAERAQREAAAEARRVAEDAARREAEEQLWLRAEAMARANASRSSSKEADKGFASVAAATAPASGKATASTAAGLRRQARWLLPVLALVLALPVLGLAIVQFVSFGGRIPALERVAAAQLGQPVRIASLRLSLLPQPHWRLGGVVVGDKGQIKARQVTLATELGSLLGGVTTGDAIEIEAPVIDAEGLAWLLFARPQSPVEPASRPRRLSARDARLEFAHLALPAVSVQAEIGAQGLWSNARIQSADQTLSLVLNPQGERVSFELAAKPFPVPFGPDLKLADFDAKGTADRDGIALAQFGSRLHGGVLAGSGRLAWGGEWRLEGALDARHIDIAQLLPAVLQSGRLEGKANFAMRAGQAPQLFDTLRMEGNFMIRKGAVQGVDFGRMLQNNEAGDRTEFAELAGGFVHERGATQLRQMRLVAGLLLATGNAEVDADRNLRGRLVVDLGVAGERRRASLSLTGTPQSPVWGRR